MNLILILFLSFQPNISWEMTCKHYWNAVERLYKDPFFSKKENHRIRKQIHSRFKMRTNKLCLKTLV